MFTLVKESTLTGEHNYMVISLKPAEYKQWADTPRNLRPLVQDAFPQLSDDEKEFLITGITPEEWDKYMGSDEDESMDDWTDDLEG